MSLTVDAYRANPLTCRDRNLAGSDSAWVRSFSCADVRPLIVCRGPIRKEALDVFRQMGMTHVGILLSEKDSIIYTHALAPELRDVQSHNVHRVADYTGATRVERERCVEEIVGIAKTYGYDSVFAGYGFMAEDVDFVAALEAAGLRFMGPCSRTVQAAGHKDEAKRTALKEGVSVTPGVNDSTTRTLLAKYPNADALAAACRRLELDLEESVFQDGEGDLAVLAEQVLAAGYARGVDLFSTDELSVQVAQEVERLLLDYPGSRVRLKAIGGGGGKGQRILGRVGALNPEDARAAAAGAPGKLREILGEVKATAPGDNKNVLVELNIEQTRHHEIQLVGNGEWCVSLGGRDCSLQMHEQKLLEFSLTQPALAAAAEKAEGAGRLEEARALREDLEILRSMEEQAERFGQAVGLDSASTFECIVDQGRHFFMEVNTRIQVEHRVSELCYALRFSNPDDPDDWFEVDCLVEAMALLARHKERLPRPTRVERKSAAVEARLNATDPSLSPHAGGVIVSWSRPRADEIRDDQGICIPNPDTGLFMRYRLAGAYDSNIALLVTHGMDREESYRRLREILRETRLRGFDLHTNREFHYGLVCWFLAQNVNAKPTTRFVVPYLTQVGLLKQEADRLDVWFALKSVFAHHQRRARETCPEGWRDELLEANARCLNGKQTLVMRPLVQMLAEPHLLSGWLSSNRSSFSFEGDRVVWQRNPIQVVRDLYRFLNMDAKQGEPAAYMIWDGDHAFLEQAEGFYAELRERLDCPEPDAYARLDALLRRAEPSGGLEVEQWERVRAAHRGMQLGLGCLGLLPLIGKRTGFWDLRVEADLSITIPERLADPELQARMKRVLAPPPATKADEVVAVSGGMFYAQEAPDLPPLVSEGQHFDVGDPLYVIEIMKMFNRVCAPFAGTIDEVLFPGGAGTIVAKGQTLFKVTPDEPFVPEDPQEKKRAVEAYTLETLSHLLTDEEEA